VTQERHYLPYDEVTLSPGDASDRVVLTTPWVQFEFTAEFTSPGAREALIEDVNTRHIHEGNYFALNSILTDLSQFPIAYLLPRADLAGKPIQRRSSAAPQSPSALVKAATGREPKSPFEWQWNLDWAEKFCAVPGDVTFDPVSVFSVLRRFHLLHMSNFGKGRYLYKNLSRLGSGDPKFLPFARSILRQNHRVTELCESSLSPALDHAGESRPMLEKFIHSERGHDRLLEKSIRALGEEPAKIEVLPEVEGLMAYLKHVASTDYVAFCTMLFYFESDFVGGRNPMVEILKDSPYAAATVGLETHDKVNHEGDHENVSFELLDALGPITQEELISAVRLAETGSYLMSQVSAGLLEKHGLPAE
jgi:hypothetical protein